VKLFEISVDQIARVIGAAAADEVSRRFDRHFDFLTIASWSGATSFRDHNIDLSDKEITACAERAAKLFGLDASVLQEVLFNKLEDWAAVIATKIETQLDMLMFKSAIRDDAHAERQHKADEIFQDAAAAANVLYGRRRCISFVAPHSLLGFELTILMPNLQRIETIDARGMTPDELSQTLTYGDVLIATPTLWRYLVSEKLQAPDNTMAVSFGEPMTPQLAAEMRQVGFGVLREIYGSTETGLIAWRDAPSEPFSLFDHMRRDEKGGLMRATPCGETRDLLSVDFLDWAGDRSFNLKGRLDGAVQIGAMNVIPADVAKLLRSYPKIEDCEIRVDQHGDGVDRLVAHITLKKPYAPSGHVARDIDAWCRSVMRQQERPRIYYFEEAV